MKGKAKISRKKTREHLDRLNLTCEPAKIIRHCFPDLVTLLKQIPDPRSRSYITYPRACMKIAFCKMCFTLCGRFGSNLGGVAGYID